MNHSLARLADVLTLDLKPAQLAPVFHDLKDYQKVLSDLHDNARGRVLGVILEKGKQVTDTGTRRVTIDGWLLEARPQRTGVDARKLEALLRAKGIAVEKYMTTEVSYSVSDEGVAGLMREKQLTEEELATCNYELKFNVQAPKRAEKEEE